MSVVGITVIVALLLYFLTAYADYKKESLYAIETTDRMELFRGSLLYILVQTALDKTIDLIPIDAITIDINSSDYQWAIVRERINHLVSQLPQSPEGILQFTFVVLLVPLNVYLISRLRPNSSEKFVMNRALYASLLFILFIGSLLFPQARLLAYFLYCLLLMVGVWLFFHNHRGEPSKAPRFFVCTLLSSVFLFLALFMPNVYAMLPYIS